MSSSFHIASSTYFVFLLILIYSTAVFGSNIRRKRGILDGFSPALRSEYEPILELAEQGRLDKAIVQLEQYNKWYEMRYYGWLKVVSKQAWVPKEQIYAIHKKFREEQSLINALYDHFQNIMNAAAPKEWNKKQL